MTIAWAGCCACGPPDAVDSPCDLSDCVQQSDDGTGMNLDSNPSGGTSTLSADPDWGRPGPGWKLAATQSGTGGTYSVVIFDDPIGHPLCGIDSGTICGEFLHRPSGTSLRVWPCAVQGGQVFVIGASDYETVSNPAMWQSVGATWTTFYEVTAYGDSSITTGSEIDRSDGAADIYLGFLIQSRGTDGVEYTSYFDNVCVEITYICPGSICLPCYENITIAVTGDVVSGGSGDCGKLVTQLNTLFGGGLVLTKGGTADWEYSDTASVTGGTVNELVYLTCVSAGTWQLTVDFSFIPGGGGSPTSFLFLKWTFDDLADCGSPVSPTSVVNLASGSCNPTLNSPSLLTVEPT